MGLIKPSYTNLDYPALVGELDEENMIKLFLIPVFLFFLSKIILGQTITLQKGHTKPVSICDIYENPKDFVNKQVEVNSLAQVNIWINVGIDHLLFSSKCNGVLIFDYETQDNEKNFKYARNRIQKPSKLQRPQSIKFIGILKPITNRGVTSITGLPSTKKALETHTMFIIKLLN